MASCRPLKCQFCSRRFKYRACMADHVRADHLDAIVFKLKMFRKRKFQQTLQKIQQNRPVKVSVIKINQFHICKNQVSVKI